MKKIGRVGPFDQLIIHAYGADGVPMVVYIKTSEAKVAKTEQLEETVFADYDSKGNIVGLEFTEPESYKIDVMKKIADKTHLPLLQALDISKVPVNRHSREAALV